MSGRAVEEGLLTRVLNAPTGAFALVNRPQSGACGLLDVLVGESMSLASLSDVPIADDAVGWDVLVAVPYRQLTERGFAAPADDAPLMVLKVAEQDTVAVDDVLARLPEVPTVPVGGRFDLDDEAYAGLVRRVIEEEIGSGEGANFVIKRSFLAQIPQWTRAGALSFFRQLLRHEQQAYWTFLIHDGERFLIGATPERHVSLAAGVATMNPISGTYRYPDGGPTLAGVLDFLGDRKETDELFMVLDEELKMMARISPGGGRLVGPDLRMMTCVAHTEYVIEGRTDLGVREILRETMFAPTVTGSPVESAARVIARYEPQGRRYYSGVVALIGGPAADRRLDSAIVIRTAEIDAAGRMRVDVGATLVRHSDPQSEAAETRAKIAGLLAALRPASQSGGLGSHPEVRSALSLRNDRISEFWIKGDGAGEPPDVLLPDVPTLVVDAEDTFTAMLAAQLGSLGLRVRVRRFDEEYDVDACGLLVMGPGPGDPRSAAHPKIAHLRSVLEERLAERRPLLAVCLSHQILSDRLGLQLRRLSPPNQGTAREVELFTGLERVGFYNTFAAFSDHDKIEVPGIGVVEVCRDPGTGEVYALRGPGIASMQFHPESVLTVGGPRLIADAVRGVLGL